MTAQNTRYAIYRAANREALRAACTAWRAANPAKATECARNYRVNNKDKINATKREKRRLNPGAEVECKKAYRASADPEIAKASKAEWRATNGPSIAASNARRRSAKLQRTVSWDTEFTQLVATEAADLCRRRESLTGVKWEVDHCVPLQAELVSGLHVWNNLCLLTESSNAAKRNKFVIA